MKTLIEFLRTNGSLVILNVNKIVEIEVNVLDSNHTTVTYNISGKRAESYAVNETYASVKSRLITIGFMCPSCENPTA